MGLHSRGAGRAGDPLRQGRQHQVWRRRQPQSGIHRIREYHQLSLLFMLASLTRIVQPLVCLVDTEMAEPEYQTMEIGPGSLVLNCGKVALIYNSYPVS